MDFFRAFGAKIVEILKPDFDFFRAFGAKNLEFKWFILRRRRIFFEIVFTEKEDLVGGN